MVITFVGENSIIQGYLWECYHIHYYCMYSVAYMHQVPTTLRVDTSQKYIQFEILSFFFFVTLDSIFSERHQDKQQEEDKIKQFQGLRFDLIWWKKTHYTIPNIQPNFFLHLSSILYSPFPFLKSLHPLFSLHIRR